MKNQVWLLNHSLLSVLIRSRTHRCLIFLLFLVAALPVWTFSADSPFEVTIHPPTATYSLKENIKAEGEPGETRINFVVKNISPSKQKFGVWSCSYFDNWKTNHNQITVKTWGCDKNYVSRKILMPGESFSGEVPIHVTEPLAGKELVFKLGFMPSKKAQAIHKENKPMGIYWSNEIKIEVGE